MANKKYVSRNPGRGVPLICEYRYREYSEKDVECPGLEWEKTVGYRKDSGWLPNKGDGRWQRGIPCDKKPQGYNNDSTSDPFHYCHKHALQRGKIKYDPKV